MKLGRLLVFVFLLFFGAGLANAHDVLETRIAWLSQCPSDPAPTQAQSNRVAFLGALVAAVAPKIIEGAVDSAASALKAAGDSKTVTTTAKSFADFYALSSSADLMVAANCLVVVRGTFDTTNASPMQWAKNSDEFKYLQRAVFQLEAKLKPIRGLKYFQLVPQYLKVEEFEESSIFDRKDRDYVIAATFSVPGGAQPFGSMEMAFKDVTRQSELKDGDWRLRAATSLPIAFPPESLDATKAKAKREAEMAPYLLALDILAMPEPKAVEAAPDVYKDVEVTKKVKAVCDAIRKQNQDAGKQFQLNDERCAYPVAQARTALELELERANRNQERLAWARKVCPRYVKADPAKDVLASCPDMPTAEYLSGKTFTYTLAQLTLSETREGSKFAAFLGNALSSAKDDVSSALKEKILPKTKAEKDGDDEAARAARGAVLIADLEVTKAEEALANELIQDPLKPADVTAARIALLKSKIEANKAHRNAGTSVPYPEIE